MRTLGFAEAFDQCEDAGGQPQAGPEGMRLLHK